MFKKLTPWFGFALFALSLWVVERELKGIDAQEVLAHIGAFPLSNILLAFCFSMGSYCILCFGERLALQYAGRSHIPVHISSLASFVGNALSNNIGLSFVSGAPVRYRI